MSGELSTPQASQAFTATQAVQSAPAATSAPPANGHSNQFALLGQRRFAPFF